MFKYFLLTLLAGYIFIVYSTPSPPTTYRLEVCRDKNGDVLSEKMLDNDSMPEYRTKGCQIEIREHKPN